MADRRTRKEKPAKPYPDFPLFPHATGRWAKKIRGRFVFFGKWDDPHGAMARYLAERDHHYAGMPPPSASARERPLPAATLAPVPRRPAEGPAAAPKVPARRGGTTPATAPASAGLGWHPGRGRPAGGVPAGGSAMREVVNHFLTAKKRRLDAGEMGLRSFGEYHGAGGRLLAFFGADRPVDTLTPDDFARLREQLAKSRGPVALGNEIGRVRSVFKHAFEAGLIDRPVRYGPEFRKPSKRSVRLARKAAGPKMYEAAEIHSLLEAAGPQLRAMILLAVNTGMGNTDVASLTRSSVNLKSGIVAFPRPKTGVDRRAVLWPETVVALRELQGLRPKPASEEHDDLVFITRFGQPWVRVGLPGARSEGKQQAVVKDSVAMEFSKVARAAKVDRSRRGFYALRHTFRTIADEVRDRRAIDMVMGHEAGNDIANHYVERISDDRLRAVAAHVRQWLMGTAENFGEGQAQLRITA